MTVGVRPNAKRCTIAQLDRESNKNRRWPPAAAQKPPLRNSSLPARTASIIFALMDIDPLESADATAHSRLNTWVAITVALLATFIGVCKVKDDNIVQGMQQAQADRIDH